MHSTSKNVSSPPRLDPLHPHSLALWCGVFVLLLGAFLRLAGFEEALIGSDQSSILSAAIDVATFRRFPLVGIKSSVGVMQTAVTPYLAALPLLWLPRVIAIKWFFSILDLLAIAWLYRAVRRTFGWQAAGVATFLYATNPWIVEFIRWIWYQSLVPTFATAAFAAFLLLLAPTGRPRAWVLTLGLISATLMGQVHLAALPWAALLFGLGLWVAWRKSLWRGFGAGVGAALVIMLPYLLYLWQTHFADFKAMLQAGSTGTWNWLVLRLARELLTGQEVLTTPRSPLWADSLVQPPGLSSVILIVLALAMIGTLIQLHRDAVRRLPLLFTVGWSVLVPVLFLRSSVHPQHFYLLFLFPAPFVLIGNWSSHRLDNHRTRRWIQLQQRSKQLILAVLILSGLWWTYAWGIRIRLEQQHLLGAPTRAWLMDTTALTINRYLTENPTDEVIVLTDFDGDGSPFDWLASWLHSDRVRTAPRGQGLIVPAAKTCYLLAPSATPDDLRLLHQPLTEARALEIPATPPWQFLCTPMRPPLSTPLAVWENGLSLLNAEVVGEPAPGSTLQVIYTWLYQGTAPINEHFFSHLFQGETLLSQADGPGVPTRLWHKDDVLITTFTLTLPPEPGTGEYRLRVGSYNWLNMQRVNLTDGTDGYVVRRWP